MYMRRELHVPLMFVLISPNKKAVNEGLPALHSIQEDRAAAASLTIKSKATQNYVIKRKEKSRLARLCANGRFPYRLSSNKSQLCGTVHGVGDLEKPE